MKDHHPEPAEIAALGADLLPPDEAERLRDHLAGCATCAEIESDLAVLSEELGAVPSTPIPSDVADRIDAALAAEAATPAPFHVKQRRGPQLGLAAAGALVAVGLGAAILQGVDSAQHTADGGGSNAEGQVEMDRGASDEAAGSDADDPLERQVRQLLVESGVDESAEPFDTEETTTTTSSPESEASAVSLPGCVRSAIDRAESPLAAGEETYRGQEAYLVVLPHEADSEWVDAYMIDADCVTAEPSGRGEILAQASYPRE
ncbi:hypothetical protein [Streptomyces sp. B6B3]|uniref:hypothetical protein n=1 Tax=Streptomyces sp. B6B3 TaxID=3153570 RepID=UPI00325F6DCE